MSKSRKCNICKQPVADLTSHYATDHGDANARFVMSVRKARAEGTPQYGSRFAAWLASNGKSDSEISETIQQLSA